eukprot:TRINITY_DN2335_c0_g1_i1.p1 TRINITY_DN2335_c0_g1~~TRINITY_DN2335_c0_g1_i1.p1  ORF type:complete len:155 (-),score=44.01 TRINITY_DN2335_c0_g1_i1:282-746(-)
MNHSPSPSTVPLMVPSLTTSQWQTSSSTSFGKLPQQPFFPTPALSSETPRLLPELKLPEIKFMENQAPRKLPTLEPEPSRTTRTMSISNLLNCEEPSSFSSVSSHVNNNTSLPPLSSISSSPRAMQTQSVTSHATTTTTTQGAWKMPNWLFDDK